jgi:peptidyl-dipeptidase Dcp
MKKLIYLMTILGIAFFYLTGCMTVGINNDNPLLDKFDTPFEVPPFEKIKPEHYIPAFEKGMEDARKEITDLLKNKEEPTFANTIEPFDKGGELLTRVSSVFFAQTSANTNDSLQKIEVEISPKELNLFTKTRQNSILMPNKPFCLKICTGVL